MNRKIWLGILLLSLVVSLPAAAEKTKVLPKAKKTVNVYVSCPVTGEKVDTSKAAGKVVYKGKTYYLCCVDCLAEFKHDPEKFIKKSGRLGPKMVK